jgi:CRISPR-associated protein Csc2
MSIEKLNPFFAPTYENFPKGRTIGLVVLRTSLSELILRTEGTGEPMCREFIQAGQIDKQVVQRLVMTKRKQVAPERRKGREFLRANNLLKANKDGLPCALNTNSPCEMCIDCFLYGFAAGGGGAQKSRIWTEDAFSILTATDTLSDRTINAIFETGTMRDEKGNASTALNTSEYIKPGVHFLDVSLHRRQHSTHQPLWCRIKPSRAHGKPNFGYLWRHCRTTEFTRVSASYL